MTGKRDTLECLPSLHSWDGRGQWGPYLEPEVAHEDDEGVVVDVEEVELLLLQNEDEGVEELVELAEVVDVGPEEGAADRLDASWKAEEPPVLALPRQQWYKAPGQQWYDIVGVFREKRGHMVRGDPISSFRR